MTANGFDDLPQTAFFCSLALYRDPVLAAAEIVDHSGDCVSFMLQFEEQDYIVATDANTEAGSVNLQPWPLDTQSEAHVVESVKKRI